MKFSGVITALATPFLEGQVDEKSLVRLVRQQCEDQIDGFVISGTTGESPTLSLAEKKRIFDIVRVESGGQKPLIVGTGTNSTAETLELTRAAETWGADAALVVVPYYNKPPQRGLVEHFKAVAAHTKIPLILYNVPARTVAGLSLESIAELSTVDEIVGLKEATGDVDFGRQVIDACGPGFLVSSGDDATFLQLMERGGQGVISVISHVLARPMKEWVQRLQRGDTSVHQEFEKFSSLLKEVYADANPIGIKTALHLQGLFSSDELRRPLVPATPENRQRLGQVLQDLQVVA